MTKADAINYFCEYLRTEGRHKINDVEFENSLREFIINNCYSVRGFGKDTESNNINGSITYTKKLISEGKISNVAINGSTYFLSSGNSSYFGLNTYGATPNNTTTTRQQTYSTPRQAPRQTQSHSSNTYNPRQTQSHSSNTYNPRPTQSRSLSTHNQRQAPRQTQTFSNNSSGGNLLLVRIRGVLSVLILLSFAINIARVVFTSFAISNPQFWALPIGLIATREALFSPNQDFNLLGRIFITGVAWLSVSAFL